MQSFMGRMVALPALVLVVGCAPRIAVHVNDGAQHAQRAADCDARIYREADDVPTGYREIGSVELGDTGFTTDCGPPRMLRELRRQACLAGADAVRVTHVDQADMGSTCMRITATLLVRDTGGVP